MGADLNRIAVVGTTGSGKSTFSRRLSGALGLPHIELDALFWKRSWEQTTDEEFFAAVSAAVSQPRWIVDGNYSRARHIIWSKATTHLARLSPQKNLSSLALADGPSNLDARRDLQRESRDVLGSLSQPEVDSPLGSPERSSSHRRLSSSAEVGVFSPLRSPV